MIESIINSKDYYINKCGVLEEYCFIIIIIECRVKMATLKELHSAIKYHQLYVLTEFSDSSDESEDDFEMSSKLNKRSKPESVKLASL